VVPGTQRGLIERQRWSARCDARPIRCSGRPVSAIIKQEGRTIVLWWWLIAGVAIWLCSGALIPLGWALSVAIGRWRREASPEHAAVVQDVAAG
jgi:hypothetical protein